jgi:hypothetical protein
MQKFGGQLATSGQHRQQEITEDLGVITFEDVAAATATDGAERLRASELEISEVSCLQEPQPSDTRRPGARRNAQQRRGRSSRGLPRSWIRRGWGVLLRRRRLRAAPETRCSLCEDGEHEIIGGEGDSDAWKEGGRDGFYLDARGEGGGRVISGGSRREAGCGREEGDGEACRDGRHGRR